MIGKFKIWLANVSSLRLIKKCKIWKFKIWPAIIENG